LSTPRSRLFAYYRFLYDAVGREYDWTSRKKLSDPELAALLDDSRLEVYILMADGVPAGFAELDRRTEGEIELVQFGLTPEFIGQGLGRFFGTVAPEGQRRECFYVRFMLYLLLRVRQEFTHHVLLSGVR
jgi:acetyltransferase (GNAT) family protein